MRAGARRAFVFSVVVHAGVAKQSRRSFRGVAEDVEEELEVRFPAGFGVCCMLE